MHAGEVPPWFLLQRHAYAQGSHSTAAWECKVLQVVPLIKYRLKGVGAAEAMPEAASGGSNRPPPSDINETHQDDACAKAG